MPLNKVQLITDLATIFNKSGNTPESAASDLAVAIDNYVRTAMVSVVVGGSAGTGNLS